MLQEDKDVMAKIVMVIGGLVLIAAVIFLLAQLLGKFERAAVSGGPESAKQLIAERLRPVGSVVAGAVQTGPVIRSGKEIFEAVCAACHSAGVLGAPKVGTASDWAPRLKQGMDTLVKHAIEGIRAMPARGGDPTLSDEDVRKTVQYMVDSSK